MVKEPPRHDPTYEYDATFGSVREPKASGFVEPRPVLVDTYTAVSPEIREGEPAAEEYATLAELRAVRQLPGQG